MFNDMVSVALGLRRWDDHGKSLLKLFGMNGNGISFECDQCGKVVEHRLPCRKDDNHWFCSFPCVWLAYGDAARLEKWITLQGDKDDKFTRAVWAFLDESTAPKLEKS